MNTPTYLVLADQLKAFRQEHGYKQSDLAKYLKITRSTYSNYENGFRIPDIYTLDKLARFYNVSLEAFLYPKALYNTFISLHDTMYDKMRCPAIALSDEEKTFLLHYRQLSEKDRAELYYLTQYKLNH